MADNRQFDSIQRNTLDLPYNLSAAPHDIEPHLVGGSNMMVTPGGVLARRPAVIAVPSTGITQRVDRLWLYETMEPNPVKWWIASVFKSINNTWQIYYRKLDTTWAPATTLRSLSESIVPHECSVSRGLAFIRAVPDPGSSDKYGTAILDGTGGTMVERFWGLPSPDSPAYLRGQVRQLTADVSASATTLPISSAFTGPPTLPYYIQVGYETMTVSAQAGTNLTVIRGQQQTTAEPHYDTEAVVYRDWGSSDHRVDVVEAWRYSYGWKSSTGHVSNRAPLETNPDNPPSSSGPFRDLTPRFYIPGFSDTTNVPQRIVYRSTDGGGTYYQLETFANNGSLWDYYDNSLASGAGSTFHDPVPDEILQRREVAPSLTSNSPPPAVSAPGVTGVDDPEPGSPIENYAGRKWYALGNVLAFSANEEAVSGVPEECFPSGLRGNFFKVAHRIVNLKATKNGMFVFDTTNIGAVTGSSRDSLSLDPVFPGMGAASGHPRAVDAFGDEVAYLTNNHQVALISLTPNSTPRIISAPLRTELSDAISAGAEVDIKYFNDLDKNWLIVAAHNAADPSLSKQFIYDLALSEKTRKNFWFTPWTIPSSAMLVSPTENSSSQQRLCFYVWSGSYGRAVYLDPTATTNWDQTAGSAGGPGASGIDFSADFYQHQLPPGNHANSLRIPAMVPVVEELVLERKLFNGDFDPEVRFFFDDSWSDPEMAEPAEEPPRRAMSKAYKTLQHKVGRVCQRFAFRVSLDASTTPFELLSYTLVYNPDEGP